MIELKKESERVLLVGSGMNLLPALNDLSHCLSSCCRCKLR